MGGMTALEWALDFFGQNVFPQDALSEVPKSQFPEVFANFKGSTGAQGLFHRAAGSYFFQRFSHVVVLFCSFNGSFCFGRIFFLLWIHFNFIFIAGAIFLLSVCPSQASKAWKTPWGSGLCQKA